MRVAVLMAAALGCAAPARAAVPGQDSLGGPVIPGLCMLSRDAVFTNAAIGKAAAARLRVLTQEAQAEVTAERVPIEADFNALQAESARLPAAERQAREQAISARLSPVQAKATLRGREIEATRVKAYQRISTEIQPVVAALYADRKCGLLIERSSVIGGNLANDLTDAVIRGLDARIGTITFDREAVGSTPITTPGS